MTATWPCMTCPKVFARKGDLSRHNNLHMGLKPHKCEDCGKQFSQFSGLKTHRNVHTKIKPFKCGMDGCPAAFGDPSSCARHRKETHRTVGAFQCPVQDCKSSIKRRSAFKVHLRKHKIDPDTVDINAMAPPLLPGPPPSRRRSILRAPTNADFGNLDNISNVAFLNVNPHDYHAPQPTSPPYYYPIPEISGNIGGSYIDNAYYSPNNAIQQVEMLDIPQRPAQLYAFDLPSTPPVLDYSFSPSPSPSRNDSVRTPVGPIQALHPRFLTVSPSIPSHSPLSQSPQLPPFNESAFTTQKSTQWDYESSIFGRSMYSL